MRKQDWLLCAVMVATPLWAQSSASVGQPPSASAAVDAQSAAPAADLPAHPITVDQVHEMMQLTGTARLQKQMLANMMPALRRTLPPYMPSDVIDDFQNSVLGPEMDAPS